MPERKAEKGAEASRGETSLNDYKNPL